MLSVGLAAGGAESDAANLLVVHVFVAVKVPPVHAPPYSGLCRGV